MNDSIRKKALSLIPELEDACNVDMSTESFLKNDLPAYFNIQIEESISDYINVVYNFETDFGSGKITILNFGENFESIIWNDIVQIYIEKEINS